MPNITPHIMLGTNSEDAVSCWYLSEASRMFCRYICLPDKSKSGKLLAMEDKFISSFIMLRGEGKSGIKQYAKIIRQQILPLCLVTVHSNGVQVVLALSGAGGPGAQQSSK